MTLQVPFPPSLKQPVVKWLVDESQIEYPSEDGVPMAESDHQRIPLTYGVESLDLHFKANPTIYVSGNLLIYPERGNPYESVAPDVFVVFGVEDRKRDSYKLWEEKVAPAFVLEILSASTATKDRSSKQGMYQFWGVHEYFLHDPKLAHIRPPLQGMRLDSNGFYKPIDAEVFADGTVSVYSETLELEVRVFTDGDLRFFDPIARRYLPNYSEANQLAAEAEQRAEAEKQRAEAEKQRAEAEKQRADDANVLAEEMQQEAVQQQQRVAELEAKLRALGIDPNSI